MSLIEWILEHGAMGIQLNPFKNKTVKAAVQTILLDPIRQAFGSAPLGDSVQTPTAPPPVPAATPAQDAPVVAPPVITPPPALAAPAPPPPTREEVQKAVDDEKKGERKPKGRLASIVAAASSGNRSLLGSPSASARKSLLGK